MFLEGILCHDKSKYALQAGGILNCGECGRALPVYDLLLRENAFVSSALAQEYQTWWGDPDAPCIAPIVDMPGIVPKNVATTLNRLKTATRLLRIVNGPFSGSEVEETENIVGDFMKEYLDLIASLSDGSSIAKTVQAVLVQMNSFGDMFKHYFSHVVPYVKACEGDAPPLPVVPEDPISPAKTFHDETRRASFLRGKYGRYCIQFDVVYVMIYSYLCARDTDVVANFVFDLAARVCCGHFRVPDSPVQRQIRSIVNANVTYRRNTELYHVIRNIEKGEAEGCLSVETLNKYKKLYDLVADRFYQRAGGETDATRFAFAQNFPYLLFGGNDSDYYGFIVALGHIFTNQKTLPKGELAQARAIHRFVKGFVEKMANFTREECFWTNDTFKVFLVSEAGLEEQFMNIVRLLTGS